MKNAPKRERRAKTIAIDESGLTRAMREQRRIAQEMVKEARKMKKLATEMRKALRRSA